MDGDERRPGAGGAEAATTVVCLVTVRNRAAALVDDLDAMAEFADAVVALDDGSTDETGLILRAHQLVRLALANRVREHDAGGHECNNRNRLLTAAAELRPQWIISLDQGERIGSSDAMALRRFVTDEALPGCAYGFQRFEMGAGETFDPSFEWAYRLFPFRLGQHFASDAHDVVPVPLAIPTRLWLPTSLRIKHYGDAVVDARSPVWQERPPATPVLRAPLGAPAASEPPAVVRAERGRAKVVCMLPAHNAAHYLTDWFKSVAVFADAVVALDDGSTDGTAEILERHPLVDILLRNPPRADFGGWNDSMNRNRLLEAAGSLRPDWVIGVDADELVPPDEGAALRHFIDEDAVAGIAYAFPVYRMIDDVEHYDRRDNKGALRLFAYRPGQVLSPAALHLNPAPSSIPPGRRLVTNIRFQHLNGLTPQLRRARRQKYAEADPERRWHDDYSYADAPPGVVEAWSPRPPDLPVILEPLFEDWDNGSADELDPEWPVLSVVTIIDEGAVDEMAAFMGVLVEQKLRHPFEIIAVALGAEAADDIARLRPGTIVVQIAAHASPGASRNVGLRVARGDYVVFFDAPAALADGAAGALVAAHDSGVGVVSGCIANRTESAVGWAAYFTDAAHCSFAREPLVRIAGFDEKLIDGVEALARDRLIQRGQRAAHTELVTFGHRTDLGSTGDYLRQRYALGRAGGRDGRAQARASWRRPPDAAEPFDRVRVLVIGGLLARWAGSAYEQVLPRRSLRR